MTDFFELPRPNPNPNIETLDMKVFSLDPSPSNPIQENNPHNNFSSNEANRNEPLKNDEIIAFDEDSFNEPLSGGKAEVNDVQEGSSNQETTQKNNYNDEVLQRENPLKFMEKNSNNDNEDDKDTYHESLAHDSTGKKTLAIIEESIQSLKKEENNVIKPVIKQNEQKKSTHLSKKIQNIIDFGEGDLGEVGEWVEKTANVNQQGQDNDDGYDSDFEGVFEDSKPEKDRVEALPKSSKESPKTQVFKEKTNNIEKFGIGKPTSKKNSGGYVTNNLKDKAKSMLLAQGVSISQQEESKKVIQDDRKQEILLNKHYEEEKVLLHNDDDKAEIKKKHHEANNDEIEHYSDHDWEEISRRNLEKLNSSNFRMQSEEDVSPIYFPEMWQIVKTLDLSKERKNIVTSNKDELGFLGKLLFSCSITKLPANLLIERDQVFSYAKVSFDDKNPLHFRMLHTIFRKLTSSRQCVRYGNHWETIGFQGRDPATDLRGVGMLGVLQILAFISLNFEFIQYVYTYSLDENHHFPLAVGLLNMTEIMLQTLREGKLHNTILQQKSVINAVNTYYFAVFFKFFVMYRSNKCTESDFGELKKTVAEIAKKNPGKIIADFIKDKEIFTKFNSVGN